MLLFYTDSTYVLKEANRIFTDPATNILQTFLTANRETFNTGVGYVNFQNNLETVTTINDWVIN